MDFGYFVRGTHWRSLIGALCKSHFQFTVPELRGEHVIDLVRSEGIQSADILYHRLPWIDHFKFFRKEDTACYCCQRRASCFLFLLPV